MWQLDLGVNAGRGRPARPIGKSGRPWVRALRERRESTAGGILKGRTIPGRPSVAEEREQSLRCKPDVDFRGGAGRSVVSDFLPIHGHPPAFQTRISNNGDKAGVPPRVDTTANSVCSYLESALTVCPSAALIYACSQSRPPLRIDRTSGLTREQISGVHGGSYPPGFQG